MVETNNMPDQVRIRRTWDMALVRRVLEHPAIRRATADDTVTSAAKPIVLPGLIWLNVGGGRGIYALFQHNGILFEVHTALLPELWGAPARRAARALLRYVFQETACQKLITHVPVFNRLALRYALEAGMQREGINRASFLRDGQAHDQILLGMTKKEWLCQSQQQ